LMNLKKKIMQTYFCSMLRLALFQQNFQRLLIEICEICLRSV
jgi:hypothetical protein